MSNTVLTVQSVGKRYVSYSSDLERFAGWFGFPMEPDSEYWAVRDISFHVERGQAVALIGQNGAGKSTLLKLITGTVRASTGTIHVGGRISAILELGLGFNPEFTGRQNVRHAGALMSIHPDELDRLMPEIEAFAEIGDYFDQPMRTYSSGMYARVAFALATAQQPDILIVDEILSVGDSYFQHKSFARIRQLKENGCAVLFVSHAMGAVRTLCERVLLIDKGHCIKDGSPDEVVDYYNAMIAEKENARLTIEQSRKQGSWVQTRSGTFEIVAEEMGLIDATSGEPVAAARVGQDLILRLRARAKSEIDRLVLGWMLRDLTGHTVWGTNTWHTKQVLYNIPAGEAVVFDLRFRCDLGPGSYSFSPALVSSDTHLEKNFEWQDNVLVFDVINADKPVFIGTSWLEATFEIARGTH